MKTTLALLAGLTLVFACTACAEVAPAPKAAAENPGPALYEKGFITSDTTWSGEVHIRGKVLVKHGVTLTILPGTAVKFLWSDENKDDIGDGELNCEGRLIAKGTKDKPIIFTSGQPTPKKKDWTFVMVTLNKDSALEYCTFEYAFTGLQVHFSTATVRNCTIRNNFEGLRFSTTTAQIEHNVFLDNTYGIRYEAHGSRTTVAYNVFKGNDYALFLPGNCSSTVKIHDNDITDSVKYNVNMGSNQRMDVDYAGNWWGTTDKSAIEDAIFDKQKDDTLGRVIFEPYLDKPAAGAGIM